MTCRFGSRLDRGSTRVEPFFRSTVQDQRDGTNGSPLVVDVPGCSGPSRVIDHGQAFVEAVDLGRQPGHRIGFRRMADQFMDPDSRDRGGENDRRGPRNGVFGVQTCFEPLEDLVEERRNVTVIRVSHGFDRRRRAPGCSPESSVQPEAATRSAVIGDAPVASDLDPLIEFDPARPELGVRPSFLRLDDGSAHRGGARAGIEPCPCPACRPVMRCRASGDQSIQLIGKQRGVKDQRPIRVLDTGSVPDRVRRRRVVATHNVDREILPPLDEDGRSGLARERLMNRSIPLTVKHLES